METAPRARGSIHVTENPRFQQVEWAAQSVGSVLLTLFVIAALFGVFGRGPASSATATAADGTLTAEYERFARQGSVWFLRVRATTGGVGALLLGKTLVDGHEIEQITPQPDRSRATSDGLLVSYDEPVREIKLRLRPSGPGWFTYRVAAGASVMELGQFVYF